MGGSTTMAKIIAVRVFDENVVLTLDAPIEGIVVTKRDAFGNIEATEKGERDSITLNAKHLRMMLYQGDARIALIRSARETPFESRHIVAFLLNAQCDITPTFHSAGEIDGEFVYEHDRYTYQLSNFVFSKEAEGMIQAALVKMYSADDLFK